MKKLINNTLYYIFLLVIILLSVFIIYFYITKTDLSTYQNNVNNNFQDLKNTLKNKIKYSDSSYNPRNIENQRLLVELNLSGVPDKYDVDGEKLSGQPPNIIEAIKQLKILINDEDNGDPIPDIQRLAFIYRYGAYDFKENKQEAANILRSYYDILQDPRLLNDIDEIENENGENEVLIEDFLKNTKISETTEANTIDNAGILEPLRNFIRPIYNIANRLTDAETLLNVDVEEQRRLLEQFRRNARHNDNNIVNDPQNVHSPTVLATTAQSIGQIKNKTEASNDNSFKQDIMNYLNSKPDSNKKSDAIRSLDHVFKTNATVTALNSTEVDSLGRVWSIIKDNSDTKDILYNQLASMVENDVIVCATGRLSRIVDTLSGIDDSVRIVPEHQIKQEILANSSVISNVFYAGYGEDNAAMLNSGTHPNQEAIDADRKIAITNQLRDKYVNPGIIKENKFKEYLSEWIDSI